MHIYRVAETWVSPSNTDSFVDIFDYSIVRKDTSRQVAKLGACIYIQRDMEFQFIMVAYQNVVCIRLVRFGVFSIMVYRPLSNSTEDN